MKYFFILGKNPEISKAEIFFVLSHEKIQFNILTNLKEVLIILSQNEINLSDLIRRLGGTVKIGKIIDNEFELKNLFEETKTLISIISEKQNKNTEKLMYGISSYKINNDLSQKKFEKYQSSINKLGYKIKKYFKEKSIKARYVVSKEQVLSSVIVQKNKLIENGAEINFFINNEKSILVGKTLTVQDFEWWNKIDYQRPAYDPKSGMLPPKLAAMMINISGCFQDEKILDPFCGSGTILQMALIMGYYNILGADISAKAITDSKINLEWIQKQEGKKIMNLKIFKADVKQISKLINPNSIDCIITEPFLGPPLRGSEQESKINSIIIDLEKLYLETFKELKKILNKNGKIVIIFPAFKYNNQVLHLDILKQLQQFGYKIMNDFANDINYSERGALIYSRPGQKVVREIFVFNIK